MSFYALSALSVKSKCLEYVIQYSYKYNGHHLFSDRHPLFQDSSRLSQLIGQLTNVHDDHLHRIQVSKQFGEYIHDSTHIEVSACLALYLSVIFCLWYQKRIIFFVTMFLPAYKQQSICEFS